MKVVYANQDPPESWSSAIFLAGPTPRIGREATAPASWRPDALSYLKQQGYNGVVFVPEDEDGTWKHNYDDQIEWEERCLNMADVAVFWIPRELQLMPAFTTNDEWGFWKARDPAKLVLGTPAGSPKVRYQRYYAAKHHIPTFDTLEEVCDAALRKIGDTDGIVRHGGERCVPLHIWRTQSFQAWYQNLVRAGNRLDGARVEWVFRVGPTQQVVFFWALHVDIYVVAEDRHKVNEVVIARPDVSTILLYERRANVRDSRIVIVQEFRSPVSNPDGYVYELAGGSSWKSGQDPVSVAVEECHEEVGLRIAPHRFVAHQTRQLVATTLAHRAHLFSVELTTSEMDRVAASDYVVRGVEEDSERTRARVFVYGDILNVTTVDWSTVGMIASVLQD